MDKSSHHVGTCALCDQENVSLKESHIIPKFVYQWIKDTSSTPYLRSSDNVNLREQDGSKEYLLCGKCEGDLSVMETEFAKNVFKKIANYRIQATEIIVTESMRVCVLSIFWRTLLTSISRDNIRTDEDKKVMNQFLADAKDQIRKNSTIMPIFIAPIYGPPPFYNLPTSLVYQLDRSVGAPDIRFFDGPHRYFAIFKLPFMFFYIPSEGWPNNLDNNSKFTKTITPSNIKEIPEFLRDYILWLNKQFEKLQQNISQENLEKIKQDIAKNKSITGSQKSIARSQQSNKYLND
jgi:hypothetical protein